MSDTFEKTTYGAIVADDKWDGPYIMEHILEHGTLCCFREDSLAESVSVGNEAIETGRAESYDVWEVTVTLKKVK